MSERLNSLRHAAVPASVALAASMMVTGCAPVRTNTDGSNYYGSPQEIIDTLSDSVVSEECLKDTKYNLKKATIVPVRNAGEYANGATNDVLEITPKSGKGATLKLEMEASYGNAARPEELYISPLTDWDLVDCDPASLPPELVMDYDVTENAKILERHFG